MALNCSTSSLNFFFVAFRWGFAAIEKPEVVVDDDEDFELPPELCEQSEGTAPEASPVAPPAATLLPPQSPKPKPSKPKNAKARLAEEQKRAKDAARARAGAAVQAGKYAGEAAVHKAGVSAGLTARDKIKAGAQAVVASGRLAKGTDEESGGHDRKPSGETTLPVDDWLRCKTALKLGPVLWKIVEVQEVVETASEAGSWLILLSLVSTSSRYRSIVLYTPTRPLSVPRFC